MKRIPYEPDTEWKKIDLGKEPTLASLINRARIHFKGIPLRKIRLCESNYEFSQMQLIALVKIKK